MSGETDETLLKPDVDRLLSNLAARKPDPLVGTVFAERYQILEVLGRGGMGVVYKARHKLMDRTVAIKMMLPQLVCDEVSLARFQREARAASKLSHPNIIAIHDFGMTADTSIAYLVMDYIDGKTLSEVLQKEKQLGVHRAVHIFLQACDALQHAHKSGVVHRDLKPSNIILLKQEDTDDFVKVLDFGVAKIFSTDPEAEQQSLTGTGELFGSPIYMSPEQCHGQTLDARSDIYALGCVLYETLTGAAPFAGNNPIETITKHLTGEARPFSQARPDLYIPDWLEKTVFRALCKDPAQRQQSMQELYDQLWDGISRNSSKHQLIKLSSSLRSNKRSDTPEADGATIPPASSMPIWLIMGFIAAALLSFTLVIILELKNGFNHHPSSGGPPSLPSTAPSNPSSIAPPPQQDMSLKPDAKPAGISKPAATEDKQQQSAPASPDSTPARSTAPQESKPIANPIATTTGAGKPVTHERRHSQHSTAASQDAEQSAPVLHNRHGYHKDYYDYTLDHEQGGTPDSLPTKPYSRQ